ncbi:MAG: decaprenyl-phosphate phosphoribosyltransferase [Armatimonadota bacterium]
MAEIAVERPSVWSALFRALRPRQWVKNGVLLAGILFTLDQPHGLADWLRVLAAVLVFCALASSIYLVNDLYDREQDQLHPTKRLRPLASGQITPGLARIAAVVLVVAGMAGAVLLGPGFSLCAAAYLALTVAYSVRLKHVVLVDVLALAGCYVIRAVAGAAVISVEISPWLLVCTTLGALLIGLSKRRNELATLEDAGSHRRALEEYSVPMLDQMIGVVTGSTLVAYMLYTISSETAKAHPGMMLTIPFVIYGVLRFFYLVHRHGKGGDPSREFVEDRNLLVCGILWAITCAGVMLAGR